MAAGELSYTDAEIARSAAECYRLLCDVSRLPEWVSGIATVTITETAPDGRAALAEFVSMPGSGSLSYSLRYSYDDDGMIVRWQTPSPDEREVRGEASVEVVAPDRCRLRYGLFTAVSGGQPFWAQEAFEKDKPTPVVAAFQRWAERQPG